MSVRICGAAADDSDSTYKVSASSFSPKRSPTWSAVVNDADGTYEASGTSDNATNRSTFFQPTEWNAELSWMGLVEWGDKALKATLEILQLQKQGFGQFSTSQGPRG